MKSIKTIFISAVLVVMMSMPVFAAADGLVAGADGAYYYNGVKVCSQWVDCGTYYGFAGGDGKVLAGFSIAKNVVGQLAPVVSVDQMKTAVMNPVAYVPTTVVVPAVPVVTVAPVPVDTLTPQQKAFAEDEFFRRHYYNAGYAQYDADSHKAFCACGAWALEGHCWVDKKEDGKEVTKCSLCGEGK